MHALGQAGLDLLQACLDAVDHIERVLALPHDDDAGNDFSGAVQVGNAAPDIGPHHHLSDIANANGRAVFAGGQHGIFEIVFVADVTAAAHHVLGA